MKSSPAVVKRNDADADSDSEAATLWALRGCFFRSFIEPLFLPGVAKWQTHWT